MAGPDLTWEQLREVPAADLHAGDTIVTLQALTACWVGRDGRMRPAFGCADPAGWAWTVTAVRGGILSARRSDGIEEQGPVDARRRFVRVERGAAGHRTARTGTEDGR